VEGFGVTIAAVNITRALLPEPFMQSQESRQLAVLQNSEQTEKQALALRLLADNSLLAKLEAQAEVERQREVLRGQALLAEARREVAEADSETMRRFPDAVRMEITRQRLEVARALASNSRTIVRAGGIADLERMILPEMMAFTGAVDGPGEDTDTVVDSVA
jgi:hypothetical protein